MFWPLNQTVFGLATSQPENNCLASIRTSTGFPPMTEISGIPAYNPMKPLCLCCDRCNRQQPTARSYTTAGVCYTLCDPCREEFDRPATPDRPRDQRDI
ncbi:hypothetical protein K4M03_02305, partial [Pseudomonas syringae pv. tomato]